MRDFLARYHLPKKLKVKVDKTKEGGFVVEFPDLPGCFTQIADLSQLENNVTDAVLTYFDVPRSETHKVIYVSETKVMAQKKPIRSSMISAPEKFDLFISA